MSATESENLVVGSYAQALFNCGRAQGVIQRMIEDSNALATILQQQPMFQNFLEGPQISTAKKHDVVDKVIKGKINPLLLNLLYLMIDRERAVLLPRILQEFREVAERAEGIYPATVTSARELGFQEKLRLKGALEKYTHCQLRIRYRVAPHLFGGIVFRFRDVLIDSSVRHGLDELRKRFMGREGITA